MSSSTSTKKGKGVVLDLPGAALCWHRVNGFPVELHPVEPVSLKDAGLTEKFVKDWIAAHQPAKSTRITGESLPRANPAFVELPVQNARCPVKLV